MSAPICELRGIQMSFHGPKGKENRVLEDINLKVLQDEILCVVGPNGSGKSTLLRLMAGLMEPSKGEIRFHRQRLVGLNPGVAMVFQDFALYPWMTVEDNVRVVLQAKELPEDEVKSKAHEALRKVGLEGFEEAFPRELSGAPSSGWGWLGPSRWTRRSWSWTSPSARWTRSPPKPCAPRSWTSGRTRNAIPARS